MAASAVAGCGSARPAGVSGEAEPTSNQPIQETKPTDEHKPEDTSRHSLSPPYTVTNRGSILCRYNSLDGNVRSWQWDGSTLVAQNTIGTLVRKLPYSQLKQLQLNRLEFNQESKYLTLANGKNIYQYSVFIVPSCFTPVSEEMYDRHSSIINAVRAAWSFVTQLNQYTSEFNEKPRFPLETLLLAGGDCEDSVILLASILFAMPIELDLKFVFMDINNPSDPVEINHVALSVTPEDEPLIIETTAPNKMTPYERVEGFFYKIEPPDLFT
jgi:hypothetical protein